MSEENLADLLDDKKEYASFQKRKILENLANRTHLTFGQIVKLATNEKHGAIVSALTLQDVFNQMSQSSAPAVDDEDDEDDESEEVAPKSKKGGKKAGKKATAKKAAKAAKAAKPKKAAKKVSTKKTATETKAAKKAAKAAKKAALEVEKAAKKAAKAAKKAAKAAPKAKKAKKEPAAKKAKADGDGKKADFGKKKPRLDRDQGFKEIMAALKAAGEPCGRGELESVTGYTGVQVRTFCKELADQGKIKVLGKGGRGTKYAVA